MNHPWWHWFFVGYSADFYSDPNYIVHTEFCRICRIFHNKHEPKQQENKDG